MKKYFFLILITFVISFFYYSFFLVIFGYMTPNFIVITPLALLMLNKKDASYFTAFLFGIFSDLIVGYYIGMTSIFLILLVFLYEVVKNRIGYSKSVTVITTIIGCLIYDKLLQNMIYGSEFIFYKGLVQAIISSIAIFVVAGVLNYIPEYLLKDNKSVSE